MNVSNHRKALIQLYKQRRYSWHYNNEGMLKFLQIAPDTIISYGLYFSDYEPFGLTIGNTGVTIRVYDYGMTLSCRKFKSFSLDDKGMNDLLDEILLLSIDNL